MTEAEVFMYSRARQIIEAGPWKFIKPPTKRIDHVAEFKAKRPWLAICESCPELEDKRSLGGRCRVLYSFPEYKGCSCGGRVENIIPSREARCPLGHHDHVEELNG